ncbi:hypothetical protein [Symmachiella dynata]|uniref:hypothetical protein n=1 Tax=Symmachiella dynata TaxID=2527995 RepID=UPI0011A64EED|nr:hypothetical protein [Symmachiella dynata]
MITTAENALCTPLPRRVDRPQGLPELPNNDKRLVEFGKTANQKPFGRLLGVYVSEWCVALFSPEESRRDGPSGFFYARCEYFTGKASTVLGDQNATIPEVLYSDTIPVLACPPFCSK